MTRLKTLKSCLEKLGHSRIEMHQSYLKKTTDRCYWPFQGSASFLDHLCYFCLVLLCFHAHLFVDALWSSAGKGLTSWLLFVMFYCDNVTLSLSHWYPGSGVVLDCIDSWSLHSFLLWNYSRWSTPFIFHDQLIALCNFSEILHLKK